MGIDFSMIMMILIWTCKIFCILILSCLGIALGVLLLVLFVPLRYKINGTLKDNLMGHHVKGRCTWLLHLVNIPYEIIEGVLDLKVKILGITIYPKPVKKPRLKDRSKKNNGIKSKSLGPVDTQEHSENTKSVESNGGKFEQDSIKSKIRAGNEKENKLLNLLGKPKYYYKELRKVIRKLKWHFKQLCDMIKRAVEGKETILEFFGKDRHKITLKHLKKELLFIWKNSRPKKLKLHAKFGFEDPALTGQIMAALGIAMPFIGEYDLNINPYFEEEILEMNCIVKGRVYLYHILLASFRVVREKENRLTYKALKRLKF